MDHAKNAAVLHCREFGSFHPEEPFAKKGFVLRKLMRAERGHMKRVGYERLCQRLRRRWNHVRFQLLEADATHTLVLLRTS